MCGPTFDSSFIKFSGGAVLNFLLPAFSTGSPTLLIGLTGRWNQSSKHHSLGYPNQLAAIC